MESELEEIDDPHSRALDHINWDQCTYLTKNSFEAKKSVFQSCGTEIADRERYKHNKSMDEEDSDSEEEY